MLLVIGALLSSWTPPGMTADLDTEQMEPFLRDLEELLCQAASMPASDLKRIGRELEPKGLPESLTTIVLRVPVTVATRDKRHREEFVFLTLSSVKTLERALLSGAKDGCPSVASVIHPEFITKLLCIVSDNTAKGIVVFHASGVYRGRVQFSCTNTRGQWKVTEFAFPVRGIRTALQENGKWKVIEGRQQLGLVPDRSNPMKE